MRRKKVQTGLAFFLIAIVIGVTAVAMIQAKSAHSEEGTPLPNEKMSDVYLDIRDQSGFVMPEARTKIDPSDLPPLPPPFGTGVRTKPNGSVQRCDDPISPETQRKLDEISTHYMPGFEPKNEQQDQQDGEGQ